jgi:hypothetical protein
MYDIIAHYQYTDQWDIGMTPSELITGVEIDISGTYVNYDSPRLPTVDSSYLEWVEWSMVDQGLKDEEFLPQKSTSVKSLKTLQKLFGFKQGTRISIRLCFGN